MNPAAHNAGRRAAAVFSAESAAFPRVLSALPTAHPARGPIEFTIPHLSLIEKPFSFLSPRFFFLENKQKMAKARFLSGNIPKKIFSKLFSQANAF